MAASMPASFSQKQEEFKEEFLTCPICTESYDDNEHVAKCLPCLHSFCHACLNQYVKGLTTFTCPKCRKNVELESEGDLSSLPNNFIVDNLKEYQDIFNLTVACGNCDGSENAVSFCNDCACFVCQTCVDMHQRMRTLRLHNLTTMAELREKKCNPMSQCQERCEKHPKQEMNLYCQEQQCRSPACPTCAHVEHRGHDMVYIEAAVEKTSEELQKASRIVRSRLEEVTKIKASIKKAQTHLSMSHRQRQAEMNGTLRELHRMIDKQYSSARDIMDKLFQTEMNLLDEQEKSVDMLSFQMSSACEFTERSCSVNHHVQLLDSSKSIMGRMKELQDVVLPEKEADSKEFVVGKKHAAAMDKFTHSLPDLCDLTLVVSTSDAKPSKSEFFPGCPPVHDFPPPPKINYASYADAAKPKSEESSKKPIDPTKCTMTLDPNPWRGKQCRATITTRNEDNDVIRSGGAKIRASLKWGQSKMAGLPCSVTDHDDGTYTIIYMPLLYGVNELSVYIGEEFMEGSPFVVRAGEAGQQ